VLHEYEHDVTTEQSVAGSNVDNTMKGRRIDVTAHQRKEYFAAVLPTMVLGAVEIKTASGAIAKFKKAVKKGQSQILGHLGKRLAYAFDFGGVGKNACAVGVCLTHLSIEVIKMTLSGVGTVDVKLAATGTGCVLLLGTDCLSKEHKDYLKSMDANGFVLLAGALIDAIPQELDRMSVTQVAPGEEVELKDIQYLGSSCLFERCCYWAPGGKGRVYQDAQISSSGKGLDTRGSDLEKVTKREVTKRQTQL
jgi:hypothetical protein